MTNAATSPGSPLHTTLFYPNLVLLARMGRYREAEAWATQLLEDGDNAELWCLCGKMHAQQGRFEDADKALRRALALDHGHVPAAAALACVAHLRARAARSGPWDRKWPTAIVTLALIAALVLRFGPLQDERGADDLPPPAMPIGADRAAAHAPASATQAAPDPALFDEYAALAAKVRSFKTGAALGLKAAIKEDKGMVVQVSGVVPTQYVAELIRGTASTRVTVDVGMLRVDGRYLVAPGDTLSGLSLALYGNGGAWHKLWVANRAKLDGPHVLRPGIVLHTP